MKRIAWFALSLGLLLSSCKNNHSSTIYSLCSAPCWRDVKPGVTFFGEALSLIKSFPDVSYQSISISDTWNIFNRFVFFELTSGEVVRIFSIDDTVVLIDFENIHERQTLMDFTHEYGNPTYIYHAMNLGPGFPLLPASDAYHSWIYAIYPSKGISFSMDLYDVWLGPIETISGTLKITGIQYYDINKYDILLENGFIIIPVPNFTNSDYYPWKGFGDVNDLYPIQ